MRLEALEAQIAEQIEAYAEAAGGRIRQTQEDMVELQIAHHGGVLRAAGAETTLMRLPVEAVENIVGFLADGSPLNRVLERLGPAAAERVRDSLIKGVTLGWNPRKMERAARETSGQVLSHVLRIHRTESMRAFREVGYQTRNANSDLFGGWIWLSAKNSRTCASCWAMHGTVHRNDERLDDHPNGRCTEMPIVRGFRMPAVESGEDLFARLPAAEQRKILSPAKYEAYRDGRIQLSDLVTRSRSRAWGTTRREASLQEVLA